MLWGTRRALRPPCDNDHNFREGCQNERKGKCLWRGRLRNREEKETAVESSAQAKPLTLFENYQKLYRKSLMFLRTKIRCKGDDPPVVYSWRHLPTKQKGSSLNLVLGKCFWAKEFACDQVPATLGESCRSSTCCVPLRNEVLGQTTGIHTSFILTDSGGDCH